MIGTLVEVRRAMRVGVAIVFISIFASIVSACGQQAASNGETTGGTGDSVFGAGGSSTGTGGMSIDPTATADSTTPAADALGGDANGLSTALSQAVNGSGGQELSEQAQSSLAPLGSAAQSLLKAITAGSVSGAAAAQSQYELALQNLNPLALLLDRLGFAALAQRVRAAMAKRNVYRLYAPGPTRHHYTRSVSEAVKLANSGAWVLEGVGFRLYRSAIGPCKRPLYRCYLAARFDHFVSADAACEQPGIVNEGLLGYACAAKDASAAPQELRRLYFPGRAGVAYNVGDHLETTAQSEVDSVQTWGWSLDGTLGFTPN